MVKGFAAEALAEPAVGALRALLNSHLGLLANSLAIHERAYQQMQVEQGGGDMAPMAVSCQEAAAAVAERPRARSSAQLAALFREIDETESDAQLAQLFRNKL